jgi:glycosyltransferase involved in cell wall biosynthesis
MPGSGGGFYCENCLRDIATIQALRRRGLDAVAVPVYLPLYRDFPPEAGSSPVFFGGVNTWLRHSFPHVRRAPAWARRLLDSKLALGLAAGRAGTTSAAALGSLTLSMLKDDTGEHSGELDRIVNWLSENIRPDVVHLSSVLLSGMTKRISQSLKCPVVCTLHDEDAWIDAMKQPYRELCWEEMGRKAEHVELFIAVSEAYGRLMSDRMGIPESKVRLVRSGLDAGEYRPGEARPEFPVMGYLSRMTPSLGLEIFVDAFRKLKRVPGLETLRMKAMGGMLGADVRFVRRLKDSLRADGLEADAEFIAETDKPSRIEFLKSLSVMCVPVPGGSAFGTFMLEAWASSVPVVQPRAGGFVELIDLTGGGKLYDPSDRAEPAASLRAVLTDRAWLASLGSAGRIGVEKHLNLDVMAGKLEGVYRSAVETRRARLGRNARHGRTP